MKPFKYTRRAFNVGTVAIVAIAAVGGGAAVLADQRVVKIGITLPFTGADAEDATSDQERSHDRFRRGQRRGRGRRL